MRTFVKAHKKNDSVSSNGSDGYVDILRTPERTKSNERVFGGGSPSQMQRAKYSGVGQGHAAGLSSPKKLLSPIKNLFTHHGGKGGTGAGVLDEYPGYLNERFWDVRTMRHVGDGKETTTLMAPVRASGVKDFGEHRSRVAPKIRVQESEKSERSAPRLLMSPMTEKNTVSLSNAVSQNGLVVKPGPQQTAVVEDGHNPQEGNISRFSNSSQLDSSISYTSSISPRDNKSPNQSVNITSNFQGLEDGGGEDDGDDYGDDDSVSNASSDFSFIQNVKGGRSTSVKYYKRKGTSANSKTNFAPTEGVFNENDLDYEIEEYADYDFENNGMGELEDEDDFGETQYKDLFGSEENIAGDVEKEPIHSAHDQNLLKTEEPIQHIAAQNFSFDNATIGSFHEDGAHGSDSSKPKELSDESSPELPHFAEPSSSQILSSQYYSASSHLQSNENLQSHNLHSPVMNNSKGGQKTSLPSAANKPEQLNKRQESELPSFDIPRTILDDKFEAAANSEPNETALEGNPNNQVFYKSSGDSNNAATVKTSDRRDESETSGGSSKAASGLGISTFDSADLFEGYLEPDSPKSDIEIQINRVDDDVAQLGDSFNLPSRKGKQIPQESSDKNIRSINNKSIKVTHDPNKRKSINQMMATLERLDILQSTDHSSSDSKDVSPLLEDKSDTKRGFKAKTRYSWYNNDEKMDFKTRPKSHISLSSDERNSFKESLEDAYNNESSVSYIDQEIIDEVNQLPEDFDFDYHPYSQKHPTTEDSKYLRSNAFNKKPSKAAVVPNYASNKIETLNKTVTIYRNNSTPRYDFNKKKSVRRAVSTASRSSFISIADDIYSDSDGEDVSYSSKDFNSNISNPFSRSTYTMGTINEAESSSL